MKKSDYSQINKCKNRKNLLMFIQSFEEVLFYYSFESYKLPALNSHFLCYDILQTRTNINQKSITEGNFIPLSEEFEDMLSTDIVIRQFIHTADMLLKKRDKLNSLVDYAKLENKAKISRYSEVAEYIVEISSANSMYITTVFEMLMENLFSEKCDTVILERIYLLTRILATELVNSGYSSEYISQELKKTFMNCDNEIKGDTQEIVEFINLFSFEKKTYQVFFGVNRETALVLGHIKDVTVKTPSKQLKNNLNLKHKGDRTAELIVEAVDEYEAAERAYGYIQTIIGLHRISQHHRPVYIKPSTQINEVNEELEIKKSSIIRIGQNILLRANNESQLQSYFFDDQLLNKVEPPESFFRAVSLHNSALDSKEPTNQLLDLWTAVETLVGFRAGDEDKINVVCNILTSILNRTYIFCNVEQLYKDINMVLGDEFGLILNQIDDKEQNVLKLAEILAIQSNQDIYNELLLKLEDYPLLQYRLELFSKRIFRDSKSVYNELLRHKQKLRWQIMRIYRNRNMIVHNGEHMPYLNVILGNLHYYVDSMFDALIEYYHLGVENNRTIFFDIEKEEILYWRELGLDDKGKKVDSKEISRENYKKILFNEYEGNSVKNAVKNAIEELKQKHAVSEEVKK